MEVEADGLTDADTELDAEAEGERLAETDFDALAEAEADGDWLAEGEELADGDNDALGDTEAEADSDRSVVVAEVINSQAAEVPVPTFMKILLPALFNLKNKAPLLNPESPVGRLLPSASAIKSVDSWAFGV